MMLVGHLWDGRIRNTGSRYRFGKIQPSSTCEISAVDHCNNSCLDCNQAAPCLAPAWADPRQVYQDLSTLAGIYRADCVKIVGGEPLLHPDLISLVRAARRSGVAERLMLLTNGRNLGDVPEDILKSFDIIEISVYPDSPSDGEVFSRVRAVCDAGKVELRRKHYEHFRAAFALKGTADDSLVASIYRTCKIAHQWDCHAAHAGYFYKCPEAVAMAKAPFSQRTAMGEDGIRIHPGSSLKKELVRYLEGDRPLKACRYCLGVIGVSRLHRMVPAREWLSLHDVATEELIDYDKLRCAEAGVDFDNDNGRIVS